MKYKLKEVNGNNYYYDIYVNSKKIGKIAYSIYSDINAAGIGDFYIKSTERNKGYGTQVLDDFIEKLSKNYDLVYCYVDKNNNGAIRLYERFGTLFDTDGNQYYVELYNRKTRE